jgi:predicted metal-binding membrane protein
VIYDDRDRITVRNGVLAVTTLAWILTLCTQSIGMGKLSDVHAHHHSTSGGPVLAGAAWNWLLMLAAMMTPVLIRPIQFVRASSLARRRRRSTVLFVVSYMAVWTFAGVPMLALVAVLESSGLALYIQGAAIFFIALVWQCSPAKQVCLNRCHALWELTASGRVTDTDTLVFGATQGLWCAGSCWAWMLSPLLLPSGHAMAMAGAAVLIFCERVDEPAAVQWRWRGLGRVWRIIAGRVRIRMQANAAA